MSEPLSTYQQALREQRAAGLALTELFNQIAAAWSALVHERDRTILLNDSDFTSNFKENVPAKKLDLQAWPTRDEIKAALLRNHRAREATLAAWQAIPDKEGLNPPDMNSGTTVARRK